MKQFATYFTHGVRHGAQLRAAIYQAHEPAADSGTGGRVLQPRGGGRRLRCSVR